MIETPIPIAWAAKVASHDYDAALNFLSMAIGDDAARKSVKALRAAKITNRRVNDILRATGEPLLPATDPDVARDIAKATQGQPLSPILIVRHKGRAWIADGYHRVCAAMHLGHHEAVPMKMA